MKKLLTIVSLILINLSCAEKPLNVAKLHIKGSDTMYQLTRHLAEEYMKHNPGISIYVEGGGTTIGIKDLINNRVDICTASRNLKANEMKLLADRYGRLGIKFLIAKDALSVYLNPDNPVENLSMDQLRKIFSGEITNWKDLGGSDQPIVVITRSPNSGTYLYFKNHVLEGNEYTKNSLIRLTTESVLEEVEETKNAIGYGGIGFKEGVKFCKINNILPSEINAQNDNYPITRYLYFIVLDNNKLEINDFIDWVLSPDGQAVVKKSGYISLWKISF